MKALVLGATGAIGKDLVEQLIHDDTFDRVDIFVRREVKIPSAKLVAHVVDFDHPELWADKLTGDVLFSTLGTTIRAAGSQDAQWKVDYTYQYNAAKVARENSVPVYVLVSSVGANAKSKVFYTKMKGALDDAVQKLGFPACFILRPPSLIRKGSDRFGEKVGVKGWRLGFEGFQRHRPNAPIHSYANRGCRRRYGPSRQVRPQRPRDYCFTGYP